MKVNWDYARVDMDPLLTTATVVSILGGLENLGFGAEEYTRW